VIMLIGGLILWITKPVTADPPRTDRTGGQTQAGKRSECRALRSWHERFTVCRQKMWRSWWNSAGRIKPCRAGLHWVAAVGPSIELETAPCQDPLMTSSYVWQPEHR
jgi:hypothetical protein